MARHCLYWKRICDYFHSNKDFESNRSHNSLFHRWSTFQGSVTKFNRYVTRIKGIGQNGLTTKEKVTY
ncbi:hypothetical protein U9M48_041645, partial [Paspalum notatum var. saurae]